MENVSVEMDVTYHININKIKEKVINMKDGWYNNSPREQRRLANLESADMLEEMLLLRNHIKRQNNTIRKLENQSLISIIKDRFNKWFFGTKG